MIAAGPRHRDGAGSAAVSRTGRAELERDNDESRSTP